VDAETVTPLGLTYRLRVGTTPEGIEIMSPHADVATGKRRVTARGNVSATNTWALRNLPRGTYYWSVQAIDSAFAGSPFGAEATFAITNARPGISTITSSAPVSETGGLGAIPGGAATPAISTKNKHLTAP